MYAKASSFEARKDENKNENIFYSLIIFINLFVFYFFVKSVIHNDDQIFIFNEIIYELS